MPNMLMDANIQFPNTEGKDTKQSLNELTNYLFMLLENLRYTLANLDKENFNDEGLKEIGQIITKPIAAALKNANDEITKMSVRAGAIETEVSNAKGDITRVSQKVDSLRLGVSNGEESSTISLEAGGAVISSQVIEFNGFVKFSDLSGSGSTYINGDNIRTGTIRAIDISGSEITGSVITGGRIKGIDLEVGNSSNGVGSIDFMSNWGRVGGLRTDGQERVWLTSNINVPIKISSGGGISLEAVSNVYISADTYLTLRGDRIYLQSDNIYIGNETIESFIRRIAR